MVATKAVTALPRAEGGPLLLPSAVLKDCPDERLSRSVGLELLVRDSVSESGESGLRSIL